MSTLLARQTAASHQRPGTGRLAALTWLAGQTVRADPLASGAWVTVAVGRGVLVPLQLWATKSLVDGLQELLAGHRPQPIGLWLTWVVAALLLGQLAAAAEPWLQVRLWQASGRRLTERVLAQAAQLDLAALEQPAAHDLLSRVIGGSEHRPSGLLQELLRAGHLLPVLLGYAGALFALSPALVAIATGSMMLALAVAMQGGGNIWQLLRDQSFERRLANYYADLLTDRRSAAEVRLYGLAPYLLGRWTALYWEAQNAQRRLALRMGLRQATSLVFSLGATALALWWVAARLSRVHSAGLYAVLFQAVGGFLSALHSLAGCANQLGQHAGYAADLQSFLALPVAEAGKLPRGTHHGDPDPAPADRPARWADAATPVSARRSFPRPLRDGVRFEEVWFSYPGADAPTLCGVSLHLRPGERVALVGENGAGKSTLAKLLLGLYRPSAGRITVDGVDPQAIDPAERNSALAAVFQSYVRYPLTVAENIGLGRIERLHDRAALEAAAARTGVDALVASLPRGWETMLGPAVGGVDLSGGQWQKLALARAFFRDAEILVLDEPTAALDPKAELAVFQLFAQLAAGKTALLISHRLGMARLADRILVLRQGRLVEEGTHDALLQAAGVYAALFEAQARWYR